VDEQFERDQSTASPATAPAGSDDRPLVPQLTGISKRREVRVAGIKFSGRRRRPVGARSPLPRELRTSGWIWLIIGLSTVVLWMTLFAYPGTREWWEARDLTINQWFVDLRNDAATDLMRALHALGSPWLFRPLRLLTVLVLIVFKRWRHVFGALIVFVSVEAVATGLAEAIGRPRPLVEILGSWQGYSHPAAPVAAVAATFGVMGQALCPRGRARNWWMAGAGVLMALLVIARVYLGVDHLTDSLVGALFGVAVAVVVFRLFVPDAVFPVTYTRGSAAHLDIGGRRGKAIRAAVSDQLGIEVLSMKHFGLEGSGGSTPILLTVAGDPDRHLFAKLYSTNHLRADRWYKAGRTILYGSLEDEVKFSSVRRLVEYEDYLLMKFNAADVPSAEPFGFVEITPEREYLIVTEFLQDAEEISDAVVDEDVIDDALLMVRRLWDGGLAHRDIKPANVLVKDGEVRLIDVAFGTIRPSPWRQSVDLANMMIILGLRADPELVYARALKFFAPDDVAEAFAATRSVTVPSQSRSSLKMLKRAEGLDVIERFRDLSPPCEPIAIQRWNARRVWLTAGAALAVAVLASLLWSNITSGAFV
jgi:membrane-associated phospholipid phosphatase